MGRLPRALEVAGRLKIHWPQGPAWHPSPTLYVTLSRPAPPASAANNSREILGLQLQDMQQYVPQDELYRAVEQALVTIVSQVCHLKQSAC